MSFKIIEFLSKALTKNKELVFKDEFGEVISNIKVFNNNVFLSVSKPVGICRNCKGPVYRDNKTSFKYHCPNEETNLYDNGVIINKTK